MPRPPLVERAFIQLALLNSARNDIVHFGAEFSDREREYIATNARLAHTAQQVRRHTLDTTTLFAIMNDLFRNAWNALAIERLTRTLSGI